MIRSGFRSSRFYCAEDNSVAQPFSIESNWGAVSIITWHSSDWILLLFPWPFVIWASFPVTQFSTRHTLLPPLFPPPLLDVGGGVPTTCEKYPRTWREAPLTPHNCPARWCRPIVSVFMPLLPMIASCQRCPLTVPTQSCPPTPVNSEKWQL